MRIFLLKYQFFFLQLPLTGTLLIYCFFQDQNVEIPLKSCYCHYEENTLFNSLYLYRGKMCITISNVITTRN